MIQNGSQPLSKQQRQFIFFVIIGTALAIILVASLLNQFLNTQFGPPNLEATVTAVAIQSTQVAIAASQSSIDATKTAINASSISASALAPLPDDPMTWDGLHIEVIGVNPDAWPLIEAHNYLNDPPEPNKKMLLLTLRVSNVEGPEEGFISMDNSDLAVIGDQQTLYKPYQNGVSCGVVPSRLDGTMSRGMTMIGNICVQVPNQEKELLLVYSSYDHPSVYISIPTE